MTALYAERIRDLLSITEIDARHTYDTVGPYSAVKLAQLPDDLVANRRPYMGVLLYERPGLLFCIGNFDVTSAFCLCISDGEQFFGFSGRGHAEDTLDYLVGKQREWANGRRQSDYIAHFAERARDGSRATDC